MTITTSTGAALAAAMDRAEQLRNESPRRPRVRILTQFGDHKAGVTIVARIAAKTGPELEVQSEKGVRFIAFADLDARASELVSLVEEATAEVIAAVEAAPPPAPRPSTDMDGWEDAFEALQREASHELFNVVDRLVRDVPVNLGRQLGAEACSLGAFRVAALTALAAGIDTGDLSDMLNSTVEDLKRQGPGRLPGATAH